MIRWTRPAEEQSDEEDDIVDEGETEAEKTLRRGAAVRRPNK